jgi:rhamnulose-1-phosphate aldolase/alcohol dehydrogenase
MRNRWSDRHTHDLDELDKLVYMSRLIGEDPSLVLWGGGNTSMKLLENDFRDREVSAMWIKGSGSDMKSMVRRQFPRLRLDDILPLFERSGMSDEDMVAYLERCLMDPNTPRPSIETLLHAFLPFMSVAHSHADAVVALTNNRDATEVLQKVYGDSVATVEYLRPGFQLSKLVGLAVQESPRISGVVLVNHGLFTWGDSTKEAYDRHIDLVSQAEEYIKSGSKSVFGGWARNPLDAEERRRVASAIAPTLRGLVSRRQQMVLRFDDSPDVLEFLGSAEGRRLSGIGPATPDHLIHTKRRPLWLDVPDASDVPAVLQELGPRMDDYAQEYASWYQEHTAGEHPMLDPYPRVILLPGVGMWTTGKDALAAQIVADIYHHTISVIASAQSVSDYTSLTPRDAYDAEYWPLELYKLTLAPPEKELARQVALVTGAAGGIGKAIALRLASEGAHVVITDVDTEGAGLVAQEINQAYGLGRGTAFPMDVADAGQVTRAFQDLRLAYGGLDVLVSNAGIAPVGAIDALSLADWQKALDINTTGHFLVAAEAIRLMKEQGTGGSLVFIGTKNVPAPGADFGAYSVSKAAEVQLARVIALENGQYGIRSNVVNPDAIFQGSRLWSDQVRQERASAHGVPLEGLEQFYHQRTLLKVQVRAEDVAEAVLFLASQRSSRTTGAMLPVDGGVREAFPR